MRNSFFLCLLDRLRDRLSSIGSSIKKGVSTAIMYLNPFYRVGGSLSSAASSAGGFFSGFFAPLAGFFHTTITIGKTAIQLIIAVLILIGLFLLWGVLAGVLGGLSSRGFSGASRPSGAMSTVFLWLITEDIARIASILGQGLGAAAVTVFGYVLLFLGLRGSLQIPAPKVPRKIR